MFDDNRPNAGWMIVVTVALTFVLSVIPLPKLVEYARPEWVAMALIYWVIILPHRVGIVSAWGAGLVMDVLAGSVIGQHALSLSIMVFVTHVLHLRIRVFPILQQSTIVAILVGTHLLVNIMVQTLVSTNRVEMWYWLPIISSGLIWPLVLLILRALTARFQVN